MPTTTDQLRHSIRGVLQAIESQQGFTVQQGTGTGKLYYMWGFINNTLRMVENAARSPEQKEDAVQRSMMASVLIDDTSGKLTMLTGGDATEFDADVKTKAKEMASLASEWGFERGAFRE